MKNWTIAVIATFTVVAAAQASAAGGTITPQVFRAAPDGQAQHYPESASLARFLEGIGARPNPARAGRPATAAVSLDHVVRRIDWARGVPAVSRPRAPSPDFSLSEETPAGKRQATGARRQAVMDELRGVFGRSVAEPD